VPPTRGIVVVDLGVELLNLFEIGSEVLLIRLTANTRFFSPLVLIYDHLYRHLLSLISANEPVKCQTTQKAAVSNLKGFPKELRYHNRCSLDFYGLRVRVVP
jgi:hypothetical protein